MKIKPFLPLLLLAACSHPPVERPRAPAFPFAAVPQDSVRARHEVYAKQFAISTRGEGATKAARRMFELGGNIVDAAAAASFAISVERPISTGLGGGGFMLIHLAKTNETLAVDFREKAPLKATEKMYLDAKGEVVPKLSTEGILSSGTPGMVAGVLAVHDKYGALRREQVLRPAIELAEKGFRVYPDLANAFKETKDLLKKFRSTRKVFFKKDGGFYQTGDLFKQPDLAKTLRAISKHGRDGFYKGWVARAMLEEQKRYRGLITQQDLDAYEVKFRKPVTGMFKGYEIMSMPPSSSGGIHVIEILKILKDDDLKSLGPYSPEAIHLTASAMQSAFADRAEHLGDTDFVPVPVRWLVSDDYTAQVRRSVPASKARPSSEVKAEAPLPYESSETTHFSIMDREGNAVASTQTVNGYFGSGVVVSGAGFLMNNEMDDFSVKPGVPNMFGAVGGDKNAIRPAKRPLSSMSPTIVMKDGRPVLALGSPSGTRIISCVALTILNYLEYGMPLYEAVAAVRYHHQWLPDEIRVDEPSFPSKITKELVSMGYKVRQQNLGCRVEAVAREGYLLHGVSDPRSVESLSAGERSAASVRK